MFQDWWENMGYHGYWHQSKLLQNFGVKEMFEPLGGAILVHGKQYNPMLPPRQTRRLSADETYPKFNEAADKYDSTSGDVPYFWLIPQTGGFDRYMAACLRLVSASQSGVEFDGHDKDNFLSVVGLGKERFINVDTVHEEGIQRAVSLGLPGSGLADVVVSPLVNLAPDLFTQESKGRIFTVFRHPIERAISMFHYLGTAHWEPNYQPQLQGWTLKEFAESDFVESNWMVRFLSNKTEGMVTHDDFHLAEYVLRTKILVGLSSELEETAERFQNYFGWTFRHNPEEQAECREHWIDQDLASESVIDQESKAWKLLSDQNMFDIMLYEIAQEVWAEQGDWLSKTADDLETPKTTCCECDPPINPDGFDCSSLEVPAAPVRSSRTLTELGIVPSLDRRAQNVCSPYDPNCDDNSCSAAFPCDVCEARDCKFNLWQ
jgi:hypothetical protein